MQSKVYSIDERKLLPAYPGIYKFYDKNKMLIYVGKAKNIKKRVNSYFNASTNISLKTKKMTAQIDSIEYTTVNIFCPTSSSERIIIGK